jgi:hypothetical protein
LRRLRRRRRRCMMAARRSGSASAEATATATPAAERCASLLTSSRLVLPGRSERPAIAVLLCSLVQLAVCGARHLRDPCRALLANCVHSHISQPHRRARHDETCLRPDTLLSSRQHGTGCDYVGINECGRETWNECEGDMRRGRE